MKMKKILNRIFVTLTAFLLMLFVGFESTLSISARAEETEMTENPITAESDVMDDLNRFSSEGLTFDPTYYPDNADDYSLSVLTIAEGSKGELFVYVYQPSHATVDLIAVNLSMSTLPTGDENAEWKLYYLTLLDTDGVFDKYQVDRFTVSTDSVRFYDISRISRAYDSVLDGSSGGVSQCSVTNDQTIETVAFEVGRCWEVKVVDGKVTYYPTKVDVIEITNAWFDNITYSNGYFGSKYMSKCDAWFFALSADMKIDELIEADLVYSYNTYSVHYVPPGLLDLDGSETKTLTDSGTNVPLFLNDKQTGSNPGGGIWGYSWSWDRIVRISDFLNDNGSNLSEDCKNVLRSEEFNGGWVLRFLETDYVEFYSDAGTTYTDYTDITEVTVLRLKFKTDGVVYNLGVVANSYNPDQIPGGEYDTGDGIKENFNEFLKRLEEMFNDFAGFMKGIVGGFVVILAIGALVFVVWIFVSVLRFICDTIKKIFKRKK